MRLWSEILQVEDTLFRKIFNHYRPELHYMRGPGPKWLEKHSAVAECAMPQVSGSGGSKPTLAARVLHLVGDRHSRRPAKSDFTANR
jgi:hypothetical protein